MGLSPNQWQIMIARVSRMLDAELAGCTAPSVNHLRLIIISLSIDLVAQILLIDIVLFWSALNDVHHIRRSTLFERF